MSWAVYRGRHARRSIVGSATAVTLVASSLAFLQAVGGGRATAGPPPGTALPNFARVSVASNGSQANGPSEQASVSSDGQSVAFTSFAGNLGPANGGIFLRNVTSATTTPVYSGGASWPLASDGGAAVTYLADTNEYAGIQGGIYQWSAATNSTTTVLLQGPNFADPQVSGRASASSDGSKVAYVVRDNTCSTADGPSFNLNISSTAWQFGSVYVWNRSTGTSTLLESCAGDVAISPDGSTLAWVKDVGGALGVYTQNVASNAVNEVSLGHGGTPLDETEIEDPPTLSSNGRYVIFETDVLADGTPGSGSNYAGIRIVERDTTAAFTYSVPFQVTAGAGHGSDPRPDQQVAPSVTADGHHIAYVYHPAYDAAVATLPSGQAMVANMVSGTLQRADVTARLRLPAPGYVLQQTAIAGAGRYVVFSSDATDLVPGDTNAPTFTAPRGGFDVFFRDLTGTPPMIPAGEVRQGDAFCPVCQAIEARLDPINTATGAYETDAHDISLPGVGVPFALARSYSSDNTGVGDFGVGWQVNLTSHLAVLPSGDVQVTAGTGAVVVFHAQGDGTFVAPPEVRATLTANADGSWQIETTDQLTSHYDASGRLTAQVDRNGQGLSYAYGVGGKLATVTDAGGRVVQFTRGTSGPSAGLITAVSVPDGRAWAYTYSYGSDGVTPVLTSEVDPVAGATTYGYDANNLLATVTDPNGHVVVSVAYSGGTVSSLVEAGSSTPGSYQFNAATGTATTTDPNGGVWTDTYLGNELTSETDPLGNTTNYLYDANGNRIAVTDALGNTTAFTYDANGNRLSETDPLGNVTGYTYDTNNNMLSQTDPLGHVTTYTYDAHGNRLSQTDAAGGVHTWTYTAGGQVASETDPLGHVTTYTYDASGDTTSTTVAAGTAIATTTI
ncbi:MAG TPA: DUF6531 domain-containing protein, partial [Acidothermaceae bacterium]